jgi:hypothetical protein
MELATADGTAYFWRYDIQHIDIKHNDTQHKWLISDTQHKRHSA